jgi:branched-chain amino acid transport system substrate-binding protein
LKTRVIYAVAILTLLGFAYVGYHLSRDSRIVVAVDAPTTLRTVFDPSDLDAARLYLEEKPDSRIRLTPLYYEMDPAKSAPGFIRARNDGIRFFITTQPSSTLVASKDLFSNDVALLINTSATSPFFSGEDDFILRVIPDGVQEQQQIADFVNMIPGKRLLVLQDEDNAAYTDPAVAHFAQRLKVAGEWSPTIKKISIENYRLDEMTDLFAQPFDALYVLAGDFHPAIGNLVQRFHHLHPTAPIILTPWARSAAIYETSGDAISRIVLLSHFPAQQEDAQLSAYFYRFEKRFGYKPIAMAIKIRAALEMLEQAFSKGHTTPATVKKYLLEQEKIQTSLFPITFDRFGDSTLKLQPITDLARELKSQ